MKKLLVITLILMVTLSGCFLSDNSTAVIEGENGTYTFTKETVYLLYRETITYPDGTEYFREFENELTKPGSNYIYHGILSVNGEETGTCYREYDPLGNLIIEQDDTTQWKYELTYNDADQIIKKVTFINGEETTTEEYTYTDNMLTETTVTENGALIRRLLTEYDDNGNRNMTTEYDSSGSIVGISRYEREESKEIARDFSPEDVLLGYQINVYSHQNKIVKEECFTPDGTLTKTSVWWYLGSSYTYLDIE